MMSLSSKVSELAQRVQEITGLADEVLKLLPVWASTAKGLEQQTAELQGVQAQLFEATASLAKSNAERVRVEQVIADAKARLA